MNPVKIATIAIIVICLIIAGLYYSHHKAIDNGNSDKNLNILNFTMKMDKNQLPGNISLNYIFKNEGTNSFNFSAPIFGKVICTNILAPNGTEYQWSGPVDLGLVGYNHLSPEEEFQFNYSIPSVIRTTHFGRNYTSWYNSTLNEYWFFIPGNYQIYATYPSMNPAEYNYTAFDGTTEALGGIWKSNYIDFTIQ